MGPIYNNIYFIMQIYLFWREILIKKNDKEIT